MKFLNIFKYVMILLCAIALIIGISGGGVTYLISINHPIFGLIWFILSLGLSITSVVCIVEYIENLW